MDKESAINLIKDTFENSFDEGRFTNFVNNLFNKITLAPFEYKGAYIPEAYNKYINKYKRIGKYFVEDKRIDILIVYLNKESSIERARSMQRNFIAGYLTGKFGSYSGKDAAVCAFVSPSYDDWRFSLVKMEYKLSQTKTGRTKGEEEFTPARRYSFLVGKNEPNHTAQQQLLHILMDDVNNPTLEQLEKAFSVEKVTKEFLYEYRNLYLDLQDSINNIVSNDQNVYNEFEKHKVNINDFSKILLGQIVFLYFLQKKGWLGVPKDKFWGEGDRNFLRSLFNKYSQQNKNFFNDCLEILFYNTLNNPRLDQADTSYSPDFDCRIPFLNGGLFEPINNYDWKQTNILLPNRLFSNKNETNEKDIGDGILDVFDRYNFTVQEDEPLEKEVALDPELLGKVFENLIEENLRKGQGAYYTPREIVHYMCQESLINYLENELEDKVTRSDLDIFIKHGEHFIEYEETAIKNEKNIESGKQKTTTIKSRMPENIKYNAKQIDDKLANIRVCDPAVGSGAFPVGMMLEIVKARNVLTNYLSETNDRTIYNFKRHCIENCLYGVDIDSSAVDIAKLRFWLSLVVDEEDVTAIKPLPNLDYKLVCGNSLIGVERNLFNNHLFKQLEQLKLKYFNETDPAKKLELRNQIDDLIKEITNNNENFDFEIYFSEIFNDKGGFDVVIGNPPYIGEKGHKKIFREIANGILKEYYQGKMDIFYFFFHVALKIGKQDAIIAFITTNYYLTATGGKKLREDLKNKAVIKKLINFNELKIFESALGQHNMITILNKMTNENAIAQTCITQRDGIANPEILNQILNGIDPETNYYEVPQKYLYEGDEYYIRLMGRSDYSNSTIMVILNKIQGCALNLGAICNVNQGIITGADKVSQQHINKFNIKANIGDGIFVLTDKEIKNLSLTHKEKEIIKPWFKNSDIKKYYTKKETKNYILYLDGSYQKEDLPNVINHLYKFKDLLVKTREGENEVKKWYNLWRPRRKEIFESPKIVAPQRSLTNTFGYNEISWYACSDVYFITTKDNFYSLKYILALLNSKLYFLWLYYRGKRKGEMLELCQKPLSEIPIKQISTEMQKLYIDLVDKILTITKEEDYLNNIEKQKIVKEYEHQIDQLVYKLYDLTEEEIKIVEDTIQN